VTDSEDLIRPQDSVQRVERGEAFLDVRDLRVHFPTDDGVVKSVDGISFQLERGKTLGIVGESGSGKSVTSLSIMGLHPPGVARISGQIFLDGQDLVTSSREEVRLLRGKRMAMIFQDPLSAMHPFYTVGHQIIEAYRVHNQVSKQVARKHAIEMLDRVGIPQPDRRVDDYPHQFSGGMRQRAAIAMALALNPSLLLADEPVTALDVIVQRQILDTLRELQQSLKLSMVMVTHDISVVAYLCDEVVVMYAGQVIESGPVREVLSRPRHPYTMGLRNAFPDLLSDAMELVPIHGSPPDLREPPPGCRFAPRCPFVQPACTSGPMPAAIRDGHLSACLRDSEADTLRTAALDPATWQL